MLHHDHQAYDDHEIDSTGNDFDYHQHSESKPNDDLSVLREILNEERSRANYKPTDHRYLSDDSDEESLSSMIK